MKKTIKKIIVVIAMLLLATILNVSYNLGYNAGYFDGGWDEKDRVSAFQTKDYEEVKEWLYGMGFQDGTEFGIGKTVALKNETPLLNGSYNYWRGYCLVRPYYLGCK